MDALGARPSANAGGTGSTRLLAAIRSRVSRLGHAPNAVQCERVQGEPPPSEGEGLLRQRPSGTHA